jgi:CubicO group peptidase (beta-lactamase class C family)
MEAFPGCQVFVAKDNKVVYHRAFGFHSYDRRQRVQLNDIYDVASVTKAASTTLMMMYAADRDTHLLQGTLREYIEDLDTTPNRLADITIDDLLVHQSGLPAAPPLDSLIRVMRNPLLRDIVYSRKPDSLHQVQISSNLYLNEAWIDTLWAHCKRRTVPAPRGQYIYSDYNFFLLKKLLETKFGHRLDSLVQDSIYKPLGLTHTGYLPLHRFTADQVVPTEEDKGWRLEMLDGYVHDETAAFTGGVGGNAGLFSTSGELGIILQTLLNEGSYGGRQMFSPAIVRKFTSRSPHCYRALGWDMQTNQPKNVMVCESATPSCFGHIGYTGTAIWADPTHDIVFVFLSNRVHPTRNNWKINQYRIRQSLQQAVYEALGLHPPDPDCEEPSYLESNSGDSLR